MKTPSSALHKIVLAVMAALFVLTGAANLWAHDGQWDSRHHYYRDNYGYWDNQDKYHHYIAYKGHNGYWDTKGPIRVFINVD